MQIMNLFACLNHSNLWSGQSSFFQTSFFIIKYALFLSKIEEDLNINDQKRKMNQNWLNSFWQHIFGSNMLLALQIMNFEDVTLTKFIQFYAIESMNV
jgi:hypothetical protein